MLAIVHSNVGLMHARWRSSTRRATRTGADSRCERSGRRDEAPAVDRLDPHFARMGALVRCTRSGTISPARPARRSNRFARHQIAATRTIGPTFVFLDAASKKNAAPRRSHAAAGEVRAPHAAVPSAADVEHVLAALKGAKHPVISPGVRENDRGVERAHRPGRNAERARAATAPARCSPPIIRCTRFSREPKALQALREADVVLDLDSLDFAGILKGQAKTRTRPPSSRARSTGTFITAGAWITSLPAIDINIAAVPDTLVTALVAALGTPSRPRRRRRRAPSKDGNGAAAPSGSDRHRRVRHRGQRCVRRPRGLFHPFAAGRQRKLFRLPSTRWIFSAARRRRYRRRPGYSVGIALALRGTSRLPVCVTGDGDFLMGTPRFGPRCRQDPVARDRRQQPLVLQRRSASGTHGVARGRTSTQMDRSTYRQSSARPRRLRPRPRRDRHRPDATAIGSVPRSPKAFGT